MSASSVKAAIDAALKTPKGRPEVSKAEAQAIAKAATAGRGSAAKVSADEARLIGKLLSQDAFEPGQKYTLTTPATQVLDKFAATQHLPYGHNAAVMAAQIRAKVDAASLDAPLAKAPSTSNLLPLPLDAAAFGTMPAREAYVDPGSGRFYLKQGSGASASWYGPMALPAPDAHVEANAALLGQLGAAAKGVDFMSESDFPLDPILLSHAGSTTPTADQFAALLGLPAGTVQAQSASEFFGERTQPSDPSDPASVATAKQFADLQALMQSQLTDVQVFRTGDVRIGVYIVGRNASGDLVGLHTTSVET